MKNSDLIQITLTRTQVQLVRSLLLDASAENMQIAGVEANKPHGSEAWKEANANWFRKRSHTARFLSTKLSKARDLRRKYIDLSVETFPMSV
jgi:hypothetical protein